MRRDEMYVRGGTTSRARTKEWRSRITPLLRAVVRNVFIIRRIGGSGATRTGRGTRNISRKVRRRDHDGARSTGNIRAIRARGLGAQRDVADIRA